MLIILSAEEKEKWNDRRQGPMLSLELYVNQCKKLILQCYVHTYINHFNILGDKTFSSV